MEAWAYLEIPKSEIRLIRIKGKRPYFSSARLLITLVLSIRAHVSALNEPVAGSINGAGCPEGVLRCAIIVPALFMSKVRERILPRATYRTRLSILSRSVVLNDRDRPRATASAGSQSRSAKQCPLRSSSSHELPQMFAYLLYVGSDNLYEKSVVL